MSRWTSSPGRVRSYRITGPRGVRCASRFRPARTRIGGNGGARDLQPRGNRPGRLSFVARRDNGRDGRRRRATRLPRGREDASSSAGRPPRRFLRSHLYVVRTLMPAAAAASAGGHCS